MYNTEDWVNNTVRDVNKVERLRREEERESEFAFDFSGTRYADCYAESKSEMYY